MHKYQGKKYHHLKYITKSLSTLPTDKLMLIEKTLSTEQVNSIMKAKNIVSEITLPPSVVNNHSKLGRS